MTNLLKIKIKSRRVYYDDGTFLRIEAFLDREGFDLLSSHHAEKILLEDGTEYTLDDVRWAVE